MEKQVWSVFTFTCEECESEATCGEQLHHTCSLVPHFAKDNDISATYPVRAIYFLKLSKFKKAKCTQFFPMSNILSDVVVPYGRDI